MDHSGARNAHTAGAPATMKGGDAAPEVVPERRGIELVDPLVQVAVRPHLVTGRKDLGDQFRVPFGDPAKDEERRASARPVQVLQQQTRRQNHS